MGLAEGFGTGMQMRAAFRLSQANADQQELQTKILQQEFDARNSLREQMFLPPDYRMVTHPAVETAPSNLEHIIGQAATGRAPSNYNPEDHLRMSGGYRQAPQGPLDILGGHEMSQGSLFNGGGMKWRDTGHDALNSRVDQLPIPDIRGGERHEPAPFGAYQPPPEVNRMMRPPVELAGPGEAIDGLNGNQIPREALRDGGPGTLAEGPRPMSGPQMSEAPGAAYQPAKITPGRIADEAIPGTGGPLAHLSPQMQEISKSIMRQNGGDYMKTAVMVNLLTGTQTLPLPIERFHAPAGSIVTPYAQGTGQQAGPSTQVPWIGNNSSSTVKVPGSPVLQYNPQTQQYDKPVINPATGQPMMMPKQTGNQNFGGLQGQIGVGLLQQNFPEEMAQIEKIVGHTPRMSDVADYGSPELQAALSNLMMEREREVYGMKKEAETNAMLGRASEMSRRSTLGKESAQKDVELAGMGKIMGTLTEGIDSMFVPDTTSDWDRNAHGFELAGKRATDVKVANYVQVVDALRATLARAAGEKGALAEAEQKRAAGLAPEPFPHMIASYPFYVGPDTRSVALAKLRLSAEFVQTALESAGGPNATSVTQNKMRGVLAKLDALEAKAYGRAGAPTASPSPAGSPASPSTPTKPRQVTVPPQRMGQFKSEEEAAIYNKARSETSRLAKEKGKGK